MRRQVRVGFGGPYGWDMTAAMAMADGLGVSRFLAAELLPQIEGVAIGKLNEQLEARRNE